MKKLVFMTALCLAATGAMAQEKHDDHAHEGHEHAEGHEHGEHHDLGTTTAAGIKMEVFQMGEVGEKEAAFEVVLAKDSAKPKAMRLWVGTETAKGSVKARAEGDGPAYETHLELPKPMPKNAQLWIDIQPADGKKAKVAFDLKRPKT